jgi:GT2 family glycosyltransferase
MAHKIGRGIESESGIISRGTDSQRLPDNIYSAASHLIADFLYSYYNSEDARFIASNNMAISKEQFLKVGGFDITFPLAAAEDREFCDRYLYKGFKTLYAPQAIVRHAHPLTLGNFFRQHFNYGCGAHKFHKIRASRSQSVMKIEPVKFYTGLLLCPWRTSYRYKPLLSLLIALSQFANGGLFFARMNRAHNVPQLSMSAPRTIQTA